MRLAPITSAGPALLDFSTSSDTKKWQLGNPILAAGTDYDTTANVSNWGMCELIYVSHTSTGMVPGTLCQLDKNFRATAATTGFANTGCPLFVTVTNFQVGSTTEQYGWIIAKGKAPIRYAVAATAGNVYIGGTGQATPTAAAGLQIMGARCQEAATFSWTRTGTTKNGSSRVKLPNVGGVFVGQAIAGTNIPASSVVSSIEPDGLTVNIGSAVGTLVTATGTGTATMTFTPTGFGICILSYPTAQTQIT